MEGWIYHSVGRLWCLGGDFRQILPVIPKGTRQEICHASVNYSPLWNHCEILTLTTNMRLLRGCSSHDIEERKKFSEWVLGIGDGTVGEINDQDIKVQIPDDLLLNSSGDHIASIVDYMYPSILDNMHDPSIFQDRAILTPKN